MFKRFTQTWQKWMHEIEQWGLAMDWSATDELHARVSSLEQQVQQLRHHIKEEV